LGDIKVWVNVSYVAIPLAPSKNKPYGAWSDLWIRSAARNLKAALEYGRSRGAKLAAPHIFINPYWAFGLSIVLFN